MYPTERERKTFLAHLIINFECPESGGACESWYDFNPEDRETVRKIEELLTCGGLIDQETRNRELAALCEASLMKDPFLHRTSNQFLTFR